MKGAIWKCIFLVIILSGCSHQLDFERNEFPHIFTESITNITADGFTAAGKFYGIGETDIDSYGFLIAIFDPLLDRNEGIYEKLESPSDYFESQIEFDLDTGKSYEVRTYAVCNETVIYGNSIRFKF